MPIKINKIVYSIEDTMYPEYKTASIYSEEEPENLFVSFDIHRVGEKELSTNVTIHVPEKFMRDLSQKIKKDLEDLVKIGKAPDFEKYLLLRLDKNITLLNVKRKVI